MSKLKAKVSTPEGVPRLFDLIKVQDDRMKLAFFAALGNTVVAKDLEQVGSSTLLYIINFLMSLSYTAKDDAHIQKEFYQSW